MTHLSGIFYCFTVKLWKHHSFQHSKLSSFTWSKEQTEMHTIRKYLVKENEENMSSDVFNQSNQP